MDENRAQLKNAVDKPVTRIDESWAAEMPPGILGMTPLNANPHGASLSAPAARVERTTASDARGPSVANTSATSTPLATGISPIVKAALPKLGPEQISRMHDFLNRKA
jgi:hypothetical protein